MTRLSSYLHRLPLRRRFLLVPMLGLLLLVALTGGFVYQSHRQNQKLIHLASDDLVAYDRYTAAFVNLSEQHMGLYGLLHDAQNRLDEETLYDKSKEYLRRIYTAADYFEKTLTTDHSNGATEIERHRQLVAQLMTEYQRTVVRAVDLATVNVKMAAQELVAANDRYVDMSHAFTTLLELQRNRVNREAAEDVSASSRSTTLLAAAGVSIALFLLIVSMALTRLLTQKMKANIEALSELAQRAGGALPVSPSANDIDHIDHAIQSFGDALLQLKEHERQLADAHRSLQETHDELEERVRERTHELRASNSELRDEIDRRAEAERHLRIYAEVIRSTGEAVAIANPRGSVIEVNPAYEQITGYTRAEMLGTLLQRRLMPLAGAGERLWASVCADGNWSGEILSARKSGDQFPAWVTMNTVRDDHGETQYLVSVFRDITDLKRSEAELQRLAFFDSLTGLANRTVFEDRLRVAVATAMRNQSLLAVMYLDLDRFKYVNDTLGHDAGDKLLAEVGRRIAREVRASDTLARMGGDEFTIILTMLNTLEDVEIVAQRIIASIREPITVNEEVVVVGASIGVSFFPKDGDDADTLRKHADLALNEAKQAGRGCYRVFSAHLMERASERVSLAVRLDRALARDEFVLFYQPIVDTKTGHVEGVETLIRWPRPDGSFTPPGLFIPYAEEIGMITRIDLWVLEHACSDAARWAHTLANPLPISINISSRTLQQPQLVKQIADILQSTGLPAALLDIEVTETSIIANPETAQVAMEAITAMGASISIDDFGTGYSSLNYLTQFPVSRIKLDGSFVNRIGEDQACEAIISAMSHLAHDLKVGIVAECVEKYQQQKFLQKAGCHIMQGYLLCKPLPAAELLAWLARGAKGTAASNS